ncbi:putative GON-4-like protein [Triplophysa rosa]|uniref:CASP8-associated protein 2 n=2 Tax=Triplophysa rosa TaxID=992332 RepID=A0A9W7TLX6_TRIRA|nr:putative GON-4-like protein [Triplophysa rosa]
MDQSRKRRLKSRRSGLSQCKVPRAEEPEDLTDVTDMRGSSRRYTKIRASGPQSDSACQEQHASCTQTPEDDAEKALVISLDKEQSGTRPVGRRKGSRRKREAAGEVEDQQVVDEDEIQPEVEIDRDLDRDLENKSRQHNLTSANVRNIIHEVITNEHVVAMMKAAINETEPVPVFEPKMTRSKLKEVVEKGVVIPAWNISPIKKPIEMKKGPQFVDIPLEDEDSSDEEYQPDEEEEDETAEETLLESDLESSVSSPRGTRVKLHRSHSEHDERSSVSRTSLRRSRHLTVAVAPMGPPPPPATPSGAPECSFLEKLHAVDEELAIGTDCTESYQNLSSSNGDESLISFRTRSKRPLRDVPLGRLEAELRAPDITPDMYKSGSAPEDREWSQWLQGLMTSEENEEEGDDEDDPEYNFLADTDEPDDEDYRNDKAVRITKKEVNDLMEELFDAFQDESLGQDEDGHEEEEEKEEEENPAQEAPALLENIQCVEDPLADVLKQRYRTVREQLVALRKSKALLESKGVPVPPPCPQNPSSTLTPMILSAAQKLQLQQHIQQHVQLLTQVNMLSSSVKGLEIEASTCKQFLLELQMFAQQSEQMRGQVESGFTSIFRVCNLQGALSLLEELTQSQREDATLSSQRFPGSQFPAHLAWLMVTRPVFLYPELLPVIQLHPSRFKVPFTSTEDCLVVLGHKHMRNTLHPLQMMCRYLLAARSFVCVKSHIQYACQKPFHNVIKTYFVTGECPPMPLACKRVSPCDQRPPVEREQSLIPDWLLKNLKLIYEPIRIFNKPPGDSQTADPTEETNESPDQHCSFPPGTCYPPDLPEDLAETLKHQASCRRKKDKPSKPALSAEELEVVSHAPAICPKPSAVASPSLSNPPHLPQRMNPCVSGIGALNCLSKVSPVEQNQGVPTQTRSSVTELMSLETVPLQNALGAPMASSGAPKVAQIGSTQGKVVISLPPAVVTPQLSSHPGPVVAASVAPNQGGLILTLPSPPVHSAFICPTPIIKTSALGKGHVSQHHGTLLKLTPNQYQISQKPLSQILLLPPGYVFASNSQMAKPRQIFKRVLAPKRTTMRQNRKKTTSDIVNTTREPQGGPGGGPTSVEETVIDCREEKTAEEELACDGVAMENEVEECDERDVRDLSLTLSESSGSPTPSIEDGNNAEMVLDGEVMDEEKQEEQKVKEKKDPCKQTWEESGEDNSDSEVVLDPELQETVEKLEQLATKTQSENKGNSDGKSSHQTLGEHRDHAVVETPSVLYSDTQDDDPHRDAKDVAFAQAYLQKVYEVLQVVPDKLDEFSRVLSEFEKDPERRTSLELLRRLKPVLMEWPELLRDFAAFLHPDQAEECGLLAEQQAFEQSRRFLRQLERTFGEQSALYRNVVCILQGDPSFLVSSKEIKNQIKSLFCDHTDMLEEFWVFFKHLHPKLHWCSDEDEDDADNVSSVEGCQPVITYSPDKNTAKKHRKKRDKHAKTKDIRKHNAKNTVCTEFENKVDEDSSVDIKQGTTETSFCAENSSHTPNGRKVVLWTREADRVILTTCQHRGAKMATFRVIAGQLGNKTATEVLERFQDLMKLFHRSSKLRHTDTSDTEDRPSTIEDEPD